MIDAIKRVDEVIELKGGFPLPEYRSLLHILYNPIEDRFYQQVGVHASTEPGKALDVRNNAKTILPDGVLITISPQAGCIGDWEDVVCYERSCREIELGYEKE